MDLLRVNTPAELSQSVSVAETQRGFITQSVMLRGHTVSQDIKQEPVYCSFSLLDLVTFFFSVRSEETPCVGCRGGASEWRSTHTPTYLMYFA